MSIYRFLFVPFLSYFFFQKFLLLILFSNIYFFAVFHKNYFKNLKNKTNKNGHFVFGNRDKGKPGLSWGSLREILSFRATQGTNLQKIEMSRSNFTEMKS